MSRWVRGEIALGFMLATCVWIVLVGWIESYGPTEAQKNECYEAAHKTGHKSEECKTFWERTTSDPVAFFTLVLAISTIGLWTATVWLYRAGERQMELIERNAVQQSADMKASLKIADEAAKATISAAEAARKTLESDRAWMTWDTINFGTITNSIMQGKHIKYGHGVAAVWRNTGRSPAENVSCVNLIKMIEPDESIHVFSISDVEGATDNEVTQESSRGVGAEVSGVLQIIFDAEADDFRAKKRSILFYSRLKYNDVFDRSAIRISEACVKIEFTGGTMMKGGKQEAPISFRIFGTQNGVT